MSDCLTLTTYFGERDRTSAGHLLADELLDRYGRGEVAASVLLRGIDGFGAKHMLRTDRALTLSEDLPMIAVAVDSRSRIQALQDQLVAIRRHGLVTVERGTRLAGRAEAVDEPGAIKLTVFLGRRQRIGRVPAFIALSELLHERGFAGATALLGVDGTLAGQRERARFFGQNARVPMMLVAIGSGDQAAAVVPEIEALLPDPVATLERVRICKLGGARLAPPQVLDDPGISGDPQWQKLTVYTSEDMRAGQRPLHRELVRRLRSVRVSGATTIRGIWGFNGARPPGGDRVLQLHRHVPAMTVVVDSPERIRTAFDVIDELTGTAGLVTSELVPTVIPE